MTALEEIKKALEELREDMGVAYDKGDSRISNILVWCDALNAISPTLESLQRENERLQAEIDRKSSMPGDHRYWEGRYRDEAAENDRLRGILFKCGSFIADRYQEGDAEYQVVLLVNDAICSKPAIASTGGEHHAE